MALCWALGRAQQAAPSQAVPVCNTFEGFGCKGLCAMGGPLLQATMQMRPLHMVSRMDITRTGLARGRFCLQPALDGIALAALLAMVLNA